MDDLTDSAREFEQVLKHPGNNTYVLILFIAGSTLRSQRAIVSIKKFCREFLQDAYELQVVDILQQPLLAKAEQIFAVPTLIKKHPTPKRMLIGDLSDTDSILASLYS